MKGCINADRRKFLEDLAMTLRKVARDGTLRKPCHTTQKLTRKYRKPERPLKNKHDETITEI